MVTNDQKPRTHGCIELGPHGNWQGPLKYFDLESGKVVIRIIVKVIPMPDRIVKQVNAWGLNTRRDISKMELLEFLDRNKLEFDWENEDLHDNNFIEEGQLKLLHLYILAKIPGVELENGYENIIEQSLEGGNVQAKYFAERTADARKNVNLNPDNHAESNNRTGKIKGVETIVIDDSEIDDNNDSVTSQYRMLSLRIKDTVDTSNKERSNDESEKELENDADYWPLVEDAIEGDKDESPPEPTDRGHRV